MKVFFLPTLLLFYSCGKFSNKTKLPECISEKITQMREFGDKSCAVYKYESNGVDLYLVSPGCCDQYDSIYDANCNYVCSPSGGFSGGGDGKCGNLNLNEKTLIWKAQ